MAYNLRGNQLAQAVDDLTQDLALAQLQKLNNPPEIGTPEESSFRFLQLPAELRLIVYDEYFTNIPFEQISFRPGHARSLGRPTPTPCDPALLRTCYQIRGEALEGYTQRLWLAENNLRREEYRFMQDDWVRRQRLQGLDSEWHRTLVDWMYNDHHRRSGDRRRAVPILITKVREEIMRADREVVLGLVVDPQL